MYDGANRPVEREAFAWHSADDDFEPRQWPRQWRPPTRRPRLRTPSQPGKGGTLTADTSGIADEDGLTNAATGKAVWRAPPKELLFYSEAVRDEGIELSWSSDSDSTETEYVLYRRVLRHEKGSARLGQSWIGRGVVEE